MEDLSWEGFLQHGETPPECANAFKRWLDRDCYCPVGLFWEEPSSRALASSGGLQLTRLWSDQPDPLTREYHAWCTVSGMHQWGPVYPAYCWTAGLGFASMGVWSAIRLHHRIRSMGRQGEGSPHDQRLQVGIHALCLAAAVVRTLYVTAEAILVDSAPHGSPMLEKMAGVLYTAFFSLAAAAFLCTCHQWQRLFDQMDETARVEDASVKPWYQNRLLLVCLLFLSLEAFHDILYLSGSHPVLDGMYFFWLSLISVLAAFLGVRTARNLYTRIRGLLSAQERNALFKRTRISSALVSASSVCMLILSVIQALVGRYYVWPCLICWMLGRLLEVLYLLMVLTAVGRPNNSAPSSSFVHGPHGESFAESFTSADSPGRQAAHGRQSLAIATQWSGSRGQRSD